MMVVREQKKDYFSIIIHFHGVMHSLSRCPIHLDFPSQTQLSNRSTKMFWCHWMKFSLVWKPHRDNLVLILNIPILFHRMSIFNRHTKNDPTVVCWHMINKFFFTFLWLFVYHMSLLAAVALARRHWMLYQASAAIWYTWFELLKKKITWSCCMNMLCKEGFKSPTHPGCRKF
jgi:hypothetical protein